MVNFLEIVPSVAQVKLESAGGVSVDVPGVSIEGIAHLFVSNPQVAEMFNGKGFDPDNVAEIASLGEKFISEFLAAGLGLPGNEQAIEKCKKLSIGDQWDLAETILKVSFPGGAKSFLEKVTRAGNTLATSLGGDTGKVLVGTVKSKGKSKKVSPKQSQKVASS